MTFIFGVILGAVLGYAGGYLQAHPDKWAELKGLFKKQQ